MRRNKFSKSVGLVVITTDMKVVLIKRLLPYCYTNFFYKKKIIPNEINRVKYLAEFRHHHLPLIGFAERQDFINFYDGGGTCEDLYDFPHGLVGNRDAYQKITISNRYQYWSTLFKTALQEFEEETGFMIKMFETVLKKNYFVRFKALDGYIYTQFYFKIINAVLEKTERPSETQYETLLVPIQKAYELLLTQQTIKRDSKHLLLKQEEMWKTEQ